MTVVRRWFPALLWMVVIFVLSGRQSLQVSSTQLVNFLFFKTLHILEYAILFALYVRALGGKNFATAFFLTLIYAITDEVHQLFVPTREGRGRDVIIDAIGALLTWILINRWLPIAPKKLRTLARNWGIG